MAMMGELVRVVLIEGRDPSHTPTEIVPGQQMQGATPSSSSSPLPTVRIQQATISQAQLFTVPLDTMTTSIATAPTSTAESVAPAQARQGLSAGAIAGFALIPVAVLLISVGIFTFFRLRKRRRQGTVIRHISPSPPPPPTVPKKDFGSPASSFDSAATGEKARNMSVMSPPPAQTGWSPIQRSPPPRPSHDSTVHHNPWKEPIPKISADITTVKRLEVPPRNAIEAGLDSPIDRSSPFRLKRGDTHKRSSYDSDLMSAWPAPPQPVAQPAPLQPSRAGKSYMERRSISAEYFAQEKERDDARGTPRYWENVKLGFSPGPGPTFTSR
ncbi:hypothetical protein E8E13_001995 [Curvularia kusanoi]|uniref:Uncharacterized protein n=1 Tax=Curvularia kusanoi TaxID=90978 RepID=A0A9P4T3R3_CURKU|nr:hypothetical protein E8E13_001995 [Curvularia kusanoi]